MIRVVIDTNIIISGFLDSRSASSRIIEMCMKRKLLPVFSEKSRKENQGILSRFRPTEEYWKKINLFFSQAVWVNPTKRITICSDSSDNKYFEAALAGDARYIITNDRHILEHDGYMGIRAMRPQDFEKEMEKLEKIADSGDFGFSLPEPSEY